MDKTLTGSRAFGVASEGSDWDYVSRSLPYGERWKKVPYQLGDGYDVYSRSGNEHLIIPSSRENYTSWMKAHRHCCIEQPRSKDRRKVIFDHYMHGTPLHLQKPLPKSHRKYFSRERPYVFRYF